MMKSSYDASGNTLNDGNNKYWYDAEGQLCAVQSLAVTGLPITQYIYDGMGARIGKGTLSAAPSNSTSLCAPPLGSGFTLTARYLVDQGGDQVTELSEQSGEVWKHSNVFSAARLTATYDYNGGNGGLHYELADPLGTKRIQANISGQIEESCISLPFGDALSCTPTSLPTADDATEHHFTQKERDAESGNDYFFARYYNSALGRFTTPDWSAKVVPVPYAQMGDPQSLNLYAYVRNNPVTGVDPDGHCWGGGWCDIHGNPYQTDSEKAAAMNAAKNRAQQHGVPTAPLSMFDALFQGPGSGGSGSSGIPDHVDIVGPSEIPSGELGHGGANYWWYLLKNSQGKTLSGSGYGAEEHIEELMDRGLQIRDQTTEGHFTPVVQGYIRDTVGLSSAPGSGTYMDYRVKQWFTISYKGVQYDLSTEFEHRVTVVNEAFHTYVWDLVP
jgi:RHS repeat-associated protein